MGRRFLIATGLLLTLLLPHPTLAQSTAPEYERTVRNALDEFRAGRWAEARALFRRAHLVYPNARTLRGIGMASFEMQDYVAAFEALEEALETAERPLTPEQRRATEILLTQSRSFVGLFVLRPSPASAEVLVDEAAPRLRADGSVLLALGAHRIAATAVGHRPLNRRIVVQGGEVRSVELPLEPEAVAEVATPTETETAPPTSSLPTAGLALLIGAVAPTGALVGGALWWVDREDELAICDGLPNTRECSNRTAIAFEADASRVFTVAMAVTSAALLVLGATLMGIAPGTRESELGWRCAPTLGSVGCAASF